MIFKYWVEFDEEGEIKSLHKSKSGCPNCKEFIVKLIPIEREVKNESDKLESLTRDTIRTTKKFKTELEKVTKDLKRFKL